MKSKTKRILTMILCFALAVVLGGEVFLSAFSVKAEAAEQFYTGVIDDLSKDSDFDASLYTANGADYSLKVIQIAESTAGELFVYVYQPSGFTKDMKATSINMSVKDDQSNITNYKLELLDSEGVFYKYKVVDFVVSKNVLRYYYIVSIYRDYDSSLGDSAPVGNVVLEVPFEVAQLWTATTVDEIPVYAVEYLEQIKIENKHVGFIRYKDMSLLRDFAGTDSHYVAFSTNKPIDTLLEAELSFYYTDNLIVKHSSVLHSNMQSDNTGTTEPIPMRRILKREAVFQKDNILWGDDYEYNLIQTTDEFFKGEKEIITDDVKNNLLNTEWVLRFYESGYDYFSTSNCGTEMFPCVNEIFKYSTVSGVTLLRLKYEYDGKVYNLAAVDSISSGDSIPDNENWWKTDWRAFFKEFFDSIISIFLLFILLVGVCLAFSFIKPLGAVLDLLVNLIKKVLWILFYPFKLLFRRTRKK